MYTYLINDKSKEHCTHVSDVTQARPKGGVQVLQMHHLRFLIIWIFQINNKI